MKILLTTVALCLAALGCEMHPVERGEQTAEQEAKASQQVQEALKPAPVNPDPPSFFPTPKAD